MIYIFFFKAILIINTGHSKAHNTDITDDLNEENNPKASRLTYFQLADATLLSDANMCLIWKG